MAESKVGDSQETKPLANLCGGCEAVNCNTGGRGCILKRREKETRLERIGHKMREIIK